MKTDSNCSVLYIPHGGGPMPLLGDPGHLDLVNFLKTIPEKIQKPEVILVISAHWEESIPTLISGRLPPLIYDYYGFPYEAYEIEYNAKGAPALAEKMFTLLDKNGLKARLDDQRGYDHGMFVPLKLMYPEADIPCLQLSLIKGLDPSLHIEMGKALKELKDEKMLILGSGFSFHNMREFGNPKTDFKNNSFQNWLVQTLTDETLSATDRHEKLTKWEKAPHARYCHPREERLLPLHVCCGLTGSAAKETFDIKILNKNATAFLW